VHVSSPVSFKLKTTISAAVLLLNLGLSEILLQLLLLVDLVGWHFNANADTGPMSTPAAKLASYN
jgi:hypothetical protein